MQVVKEPIYVENQDFLEIKEEPIVVLDEDEEVMKIKEEPVLVYDDQDGFLDGLPKPIEGLRDGGPPPFLKKTFEMVDDPKTDEIISWSETQKSFVLWDPHKFSTDLLPKRFKHNNFSSFVRQLNTYRFKKIDSDRWEFANELFQKGKKHLLRDIKRRTTQSPIMQKRRIAEQQQQSCVHQTDPTIESELEILRRDRTTLRQEILKMKQQQESTDKHLEVVQERMLRMEFKQQKLLLFVSKAFKNPAFVHLLQHLVIQKQEMGSVDMCKRRKVEQMLSAVNADELSRAQEVWIESDACTAFSSEESVSAPEDQRTSDKSGVNSSDYNSESFILWEKLMDDDLIFGDDHDESGKDQPETYLQEWEELIPKV